jgi:hypothetical protein
MANSKHAGQNKGPARERYWLSGRLRAHKVKKIMRNPPGMTREKATLLWESTRRTRMKGAKGSPSKG